MDECKPLRVGDNWALLHALAVANQNNVPAAVVFAIAPEAGTYSRPLFGST